MRSPVDRYDVAIVGGGPAGSSAAIRLAHNGLSVALIEQKHFPRQKLCGEFISPECLAHFIELGVADEITSGATVLERTVFYSRSGRSVGVASEWFEKGSYALGLSRAEMDARLLERAGSLGVDIFEGVHAGKLFFSGDTVTGVEIKDESRVSSDLMATLTLDATGRSRVLTRQIEKARGGPERKAARFVAFKTHLEAAAVPDGICEIYTYPGGYGGCSRVEGELYNLCFIVSAEIARRYQGDAAAIMKNVVFVNKRAARSLHGVRVVGDWLAVPLETYGRTALASAEGLLTVGDAAAFIDPFTGSGILLALESSRIAADVISWEFSRAGKDLSFTRMAREYTLKYGQAFDRRLRISSMLRYAAFMPFVAETVIKGLALSEGLTRRIARATRLS